MAGVILDGSMTGSVIRDNEFEEMRSQLNSANRLLTNRNGPGSSFLGWLDWPAQDTIIQLDQIQQTALRLRQDSEVFVVIGIGGSYLGARAAIELLKPPFEIKKKGNPEIIYAGHQLDSDYLAGLLGYLAEREVSVNVISKSGTTTEPAIAFRLVKDLMEKKYGKEGARRRIVVTTDASRGALNKVAAEEGYDVFVIPDNIGGRYSVLTPVGLIPIAVAGIDVGAMIEGARNARLVYSEENMELNACFQYAAMRQLLYRKGKTIEILANYDPAFGYFSEWWKQLFGESEGKDGKGIFPASLQLTTDLHSMGQYVQDGLRNLFETVILTEQPVKEVLIPTMEDDADGLGYLAGKSLSLVNRKAMEGTSMAHSGGGVPVIKITIPEKNAFWTGHFFYFFMKTCAVSGYLLGINPFDQPGVEAYKSNMFALLGKPGYEKLKEELEKRWHR